jgi:hypothetical protein
MLTRLITVLRYWLFYATTQRRSLDYQFNGVGPRSVDPGVGPRSVGPGVGPRSGSPGVGPRSLGLGVGARGLTQTR